MSKPLRKCTGLCCVIIGMVMLVAGFASSNPAFLFGNILPDLSSYSNSVKVWPGDLFVSTQPSLSASVGTGGTSSLPRSYGLQNEAAAVNVPSMTLTINGQTQQWTYSSSLHGIQYSASLPTGLSNSFYVSSGTQICNVTLAVSTLHGQLLNLPLCPLLFDQSSNTAYKLASVCVAASATGGGGGGGLYVDPSRRGCMWPQTSAASLARKLPAAQGAVIAADTTTGLVMAQYVRQALYSRADFSTLRVTVKGVNDPYLLATSVSEGSLDLDPSPGLGGRFVAFVVGIIGAVLLTCGVIALLCMRFRRRQQGERLWSLRRTGTGNGTGTDYMSVGGGPQQQQQVMSFGGRQGNGNVVRVINPVSTAVATAAAAAAGGSGAGYPYGYGVAMQQQIGRAHV